MARDKDPRPSRGTDRLHNIDTAAAYLLSTKRLMYRITREGKVASTRAGRELRFWQSDLDNYLERRRKPPLDAA